MTTLSDVFAAGLEQVRKSWGWFLVFGILLTVLGLLCIVKAQTATTFSILALGWGACDQWNCLARQLVLRPQLAWVLPVPAERDYSRRNRIPAHSSS
jgi:hypothetical protein